MKKVLLLLFALLISATSFAQGVLSLMGHSQNMFKLLAEDKYTEAYAYFDPSFQAKVTETDLKTMWGKISEKLGKLEHTDVINSKTERELHTVLIEGKFSNDTQNFLIAFNKTEKIVGFFLQPKSQTAAYKLPAYADTTLYKEQEIHVKAPGYSLVGLLTVPKKAVNFPLVVLVHGSGPSDMDETVGANKPFKDLALGLAAQGIGTIRYVKRTMVYPMVSIGGMTVKEEVLDDAIAAIALARTIPGANKNQVYLLGHSLGGMLAPRLATLSPDLAGILLLAAPARPLPDLIAEQTRYLFSRAKDTTQAVKLRMDSVIKAFDQIRLTSLGTLKPDSVLLGAPAAYWVDLNKMNQVETAKKLKQRIFVAQGGNDYQVAITDFNLWSKALAKKKNVFLKLYPTLNHLLSVQQEKGTGDQYLVPTNVASELITDMAAWIKAKS